MKKIAAILLLFVFLFQCSMNTIILVSFYSQQDYISKNLCENRDKPQMHCKGKCYLKKQLLKEKKQEQKLPAAFKEKGVSFFIIQLTDFSLAYDKITLVNHRGYFIRPYYTHLASVFRPPSI